MGTAPAKTSVKAKTATKGKTAAIATTVAPAGEVVKAAAVKGAGISFNVEDLDYGTIKQGSDPKRNFVITNTGSEPLIISGCSGSCGCTVPSCPKEPILPGKSGSIEVEYDTTHEGEFMKDFVISSNAAGEDAVKIVYIKGNVH